MQMYELPVSPFAPVAGSRSADVTGVRAGRAFEGTDWVAEEVPVALEYNGVSHAVMLASPADLEDFALGFTLTEGIVDDVSQILDIELTADARGQTLHVRITAACFARLKDKRRSLAGRTGCGLCGADSLAHAIHPPPPVLGTRCFAASAVARALAGLRDKQLLRDVTGATHAAAWCSAAGEIVLLREDLGRHNALDKLIGALQRGRIDAGTGFIVVTSRASYEMVHKTAVAGVALLAAVSGVTSLAIDVAQAAGVALLGFARGEDVSVYSHAERVQLHPVA
ncbi:MAG: formate dehydrogenase accessory sulfurtransferase FdhD [Rhodoferax sp.]|nr:formate dehydrogenase accessory sulfurtransferase FdhD [Rhodoferax sp.]